MCVAYGLSDLSNVYKTVWTISSKKLSSTRYFYILQVQVVVWQAHTVHFVWASVTSFLGLNIFIALFLAIVWFSCSCYLVVTWHKFLSLFIKGPAIAKLEFQVAIICQLILHQHKVAQRMDVSCGIQNLKVSQAQRESSPLEFLSCTYVLHW